MARKVVAPDGRVWTVRRLWLPRLRRRNRQRDDSDDDSADDGDDWASGPWGDLLTVPDDPAGLVVGLVAIVAIGLFVFFLLPYTLFVLELLVVPLLFAYRIAFGKPWTVEAISRGRPRKVMRWKVVGWRESGEAVEEVAHCLEQGERTPRVTRAAAR